MADRKTAYAASAAYTIGLDVTPLASSATLVAGRESTAIDNGTNLYLDYMVGGFITTGTTPTAGVIEVWAYGQVNDTPTYPDVLDGTDSNETFTSRDILLSSLKLIRRITTDATSNRAYWFGPVSLLEALGQVGDTWVSVPENHGIFVTHNTVAALNTTAANHVISYQGVYETVT